MLCGFASDPVLLQRFCIFSVLHRSFKNFQQSQQSFSVLAVYFHPVSAPRCAISACFLRVSAKIFDLSQTHQHRFGIASASSHRILVLQSVCLRDVTAWYFTPESFSDTRACCLVLSSEHRCACSFWKRRKIAILLVGDMAVMTDGRRQRFFPPQQEFDLVQLLREAETRWLKPVEVCELLHNHQKFRLSPDAPNKPTSGSLFLFDRKTLRYFRKDGHNWRKKKDGKTVREAHEKLKAGSMDVLHCYYAHGEDNPNFQRRSYWLLEGAYEHIVLVHYREVTEGNRSGLLRSMPGVSSIEESSSEDSSQRHIQNMIHANAVASLPPSLVSSPSEVLSPSLNSNEDDEADSEEESDNFYMPQVDHFQEDQVSLLEQLTKDLGLPSTSTIGENQAPFSTSGLNNGADAGRPMLYNSGNSSFSNASMFNVQQMQFETTVNQDDGRQQSFYKVDLADLENMDMSELLRDPGPSNLSTAATLDSTAWTALLESANGVDGKPSDWKALLDQLVEPLSTGNLKSGGPNVINSKSTSAHTETTQLPVQHAGLLEALSPRGLGKMPETALEAHLRAATEQNALNKAALEEEQRHRNTEFSALQDEKYGLFTTQQYVKQEFQNINHSEPGILNDGDTLYELKPWLQLTQQKQVRQQDQVNNRKQEHRLTNDKRYTGALDIQNIDGNLLSPNVSELLRSIQSDEVIRHEENESFRKQDSFGSWVAKELGEDSPNSLLVSTSGSDSYWGTSIEDQCTALEGSGLSRQIQLLAGPGPSLSQQQHFSILDFSPDWSYCSEETKVIVTGVFLDTMKNPSDNRWCCMFGEIEVPAEVLQMGVLRCEAPLHAPGRVLFYVTRNDRVACSEVRQFEYRIKPCSSPDESATDTSSAQQEEEEMLLQIRFARLLSTIEGDSSAGCDQVEGTISLSDKVRSLSIDDSEWMQIEGLAKSKRRHFEDAKEKLLQTLLKPKLQRWLVSKSQEEGKGVSVLDDHGQGVLHMAAALGYEWAITPILDAGVGINFRDTRGWTALHWAAHCGREKVVAALLAADAAAGALTDPTPKYPTGRTAADLAASSGHGGIAGYLAEASLTSHLSSLNLSESEVDKVSAAVAGDKAVETVSERSSVYASAGVTEDQLSMKDTLAAVRNAAQAAARIQAAFRAHSFRKRQQTIESQVDEFGMLQEEARAFAAAQTIQKAFRGHREKMNIAAIQIQRKYRGWKGRKEFLSLKQHVVKIQAHVRGHQVRKKYKNLLWTVGVLDKAILRWRRKGQGLRGFRSEENVGDEDSDDEGFLKDFRRQKEEAFEEELSRVQVMIQSPEARHQYRRMMENFRKEKGAPVNEDVALADDDFMSLLE